MDPTFFASGDEFRTWLEANFEVASELLVDFFKVSSSRKGITYKEALDQALCFGWIDGVRKNFDADRYTIRFTPRKANSIWSAVNLKRAEELKDLGIMRSPGLAALEKRRVDKTAVYSYENQPKALDPDMEGEFKKREEAWRFFTTQAPSYQRVAIGWVMGAKQEATRARRLATLIEDSANKKRLAQYTLIKRPGSASKPETR